MLSRAFDGGGDRDWRGPRNVDVVEANARAEEADAKMEDGSWQ